ncbi:MAG: hypothetical protein IKE38_04475, partial [Erysipelotrichaceae bacterium]|nr:hypothetical protein [Erysipelotrichaceae bacterium]
MFDMIIRNGHVVDPSNDVDEVKDIYILDGKIADPSQYADIGFKKEIDATGLYVFPGLIENHAHVYDGGADMGINADTILIPSGVTSCIDYGTAGYVNFPLFYKDVIVPSKVTVKAYLNVSGAGVTVEKQYEELDPAYFDFEKIRRCCEKYRDSIIGLKIRLGRDNINAFGTRHLEETIKIAEKLGLPVAVHVKDSPVEIPE